MWQRKILAKIWSATNSARYASQRPLHSLGALATMAPRRGWVVAGGAGMLALALAFASCARGNEGSQQPVAQAPSPVKVAPVSRGEIAATLSFPGEIQSVDQLDLLSVVSGRVLQINVEEGQEVSAGTVLAQLETDTLEAQVQQADANVQSAQARLATVLEGARPQEIAASQAVLDSLREKLKGMTKSGRPEQIAAAEANLRAAETKVAQLLNPSEPDREDLDNAVRSAEANFRSAEARLFQLLNPTNADLSVAQGAVVSLRTKLDRLKDPAPEDIATAKFNLETAKARLVDLRDQPTTGRLEDARRAVDGAKAALLDAERYLAGFDNQLSTAVGGPAYRSAWSTLKAAQTALEQALSANKSASEIQTARRALEEAWSALGVAERAVAWSSVGLRASDYIAAQDSVKSATQNLQDAQETLADLDPVPTAEELAAAELAVVSAQAKLDRLLHPTVADLSDAESGLVSAQAKLDQLRNPSPADIAAAEALVGSAQANFQNAQNKLDRLLNPSESDIAAAQTAVLQAQSQLDKTRSPYDDTDIAAQQAVIEQATQQLWLTQNKYTRPDIATATAGVAQAVAALEVVKIQLKKATVVAPFDAIVAKKYVSTGALATAQTPMFSLVSKDVRVVFNVEEGSIGRLSSGLSATFTAASLGDRVLSGKITSIAPVADPASRTFKVKVTPDGAREAVKAGMFVNVAVATEQRKNVLLVPRSAIVQQGNDNFVFVVQDGQAFQRKVAVGLSNDRVSEITSGLDEGQQVVTQGNKSLRSEDPVKVTS